MTTGDGPYDDRHFDDGASYVDAATVALRYAEVALGPATTQTHDVGDLPPVTPRALRDAMGSMVTGVCVVTTVWEGSDVAMTANSVTSVSLDPPLVLVCIARTARFAEAITTSSSWGVNVLDAGALEVSTRFARPGKERTGQFAGLEHYRGPATGVALLTSACATLECVTDDIHPGGDHSIVVGRVVSSEVKGESTHPLLFHRGQYTWLTR